MSREITAKMGEAGTKSGGAFEDSFRKRVKAALDALPKDATGPIAELRAKLEALSRTDIIDGDKAVRELVKIDTALKDVSKNAKDIRLTFDTKEARAQLFLLRRDIGREGAGSSGGGGILGGIGGLFGGGAAAAGPAAQTAGGGAGIALSNPYVLTGAITAGLLALPFLAQIAAGAITAVLGGAILGLGVVGALMTGKLTKQFDTFKKSAGNDLKSIGTAFVPVLNSILKTAQRVLSYLTPVFRAAAAVIAGPFKLFADTILKAFTQPAVKKSIQDIAAAFASVMRAFTPDIPGLFKSFAEAISAIAQAVAKNPKAFADFINFLFEVVIFALRAVWVLTLIANYIEQHLGPALHRVAVIFDGVRHEVANIWALIFDDTIGVIIRIGHNVATQFNSMRHGIAVIFDGIRHDIAHVWDQIFENSVGAVIRVWQKTNTPFANMRRSIAGIFNGIRHDISHYWDLIFQDTIGRVIRLAHNAEVLLNSMRHSIAGIYDGIRHDISAIWDWIWRNIVSRAVNGVNAVFSVFVRLRTNIRNWFNDAATWLINAGKNIIGGLLRGMASAMGGIGSWIKNNVVNPVVNAVKHFFGISSPASIMVPVGSNIMAGLLKGILSHAGNLGGFIGKVFGGWPQALGSIVNKSLINIAHLPAKALRALGSVASKVGGFFARLFGGGTSGGVQRWAGTVAQALTMLGLPVSLTSRVLYQMQTESGGNPNAINLTDINAQMGDPSRGLLQTIGATFAAFHVPGTSSNIYDPLANIAAAINYAVHRYGPSLMSGGMGMGSGHGYDSGGWWPSGTFGWNTSGQHELVVTQDQLRQAALDGGATYHAHFDGLTGQAIEGHVRTAFNAMSITQGNLQRQGRRR